MRTFSKSVVDTSQWKTIEFDERRQPIVNAQKNAMSHVSHEERVSHASNTQQSQSQSQQSQQSQQ